MSSDDTTKRGFSLATKLIIAFLIVTVPSLSATVAVSVYALRNLTRFNDQLEEISRSLEALASLEAALGKAIEPLSAYLVYRTPGEDARFRKSMRELETRLHNCSTTSCHGISKQPSTMTLALLSYLEQIRNRGAILFGTDSAITQLDRVSALYELIQKGEDAHSRVTRMSTAMLARIVDIQRNSQYLNQWATILIFVSVALVLALSSTIAYLMSRRLVGDVGKLLAGTRQIMRGDLGYRVAVRVPDEIGQLTQSFNSMAEEIEQHRKQLQAILAARTTQLEQAQATLIQSEKLAAIGLLASGVAHELNNPLTSILMNVNLLVEDSLGQPDLRRELLRISDDTIRCKEVIEALRDFSRRHELDLVPFDLNQLVEHTLGAICCGEIVSGIVVKRDLSSNLPAVPCDTARMEQVLGNVLLNAYQAMPQGGVLTVGTRLRAEYAEISVQDTGCGIPEENRGKVFDPFFTTKPQGTGLGLSSVYWIMEAHGGRVELESVVQSQAGDGDKRESGTKIVLVLPLEAGQSRGKGSHGSRPGRE